MKNHEEVPAHVEKCWKITRIQCDMCGALCPNPKQEDWSNDNGHATKTTLKSTRYYPDDSFDEEVDLCAECCNWLIDSVRNGSLKRK